jgi:hypothetical protein
MDTSLPQIPTAQVCRMLRTKTAFGSFSGLHDDDDIGWQSGESTTAVYWCLGTMETAGPDDQFCHPSTCRAGRVCFRPSPDE